MDVLPRVHPGSELLCLLPCLLPLFSILHALRGHRAVCHNIHNVFLQGKMLLQQTKSIDERYCWKCFVLLLITSFQNNYSILFLVQKQVHKSHVHQWWSLNKHFSSSTVRKYSLEVVALNRSNSIFLCICVPLHTDVVVLLIIYIFFR